MFKALGFSTARILAIFLLSFFFFLDCSLFMYVSYCYIMYYLLFEFVITIFYFNSLIQFRFICVTVCLLSFFCNTSELIVAE